MDSSRAPVIGSPPLPSYWVFPDQWMHLSQSLIMGFLCVGDFNYLFTAMQITLRLICQLKEGPRAKLATEGWKG